MNLNYAIFRSQPIMTINDLAQIGSHNKHEKQAYKSNLDIKLELRDNNIELVPLESKYVKGFKELTKEYEKEHNERQKIEREDRKKKFNVMLNNSRNVVADKLQFNKPHALVEKNTFESMNKVIKESKRAIEFQPKLQQLFNEVDTYTRSHQTLEKENERLNARVNKLTKDNTKLKTRLETILKAIKEFFRKLLQILVMKL